MEQEIQEDVEKYILSFYDDNPFVQYLHMDILNIGSGEVRLALQVVHEHTNVYKIAHGGVLMSMGDTAMGAACLSCRKRVVTLDFHMNFIRAVPTGQQVIARGRVVHNGSRTMVCECDLLDEAGQVFAKSGGTFFVTGHFTA